MQRNNYIRQILRAFFLGKLDEVSENSIAAVLE